MLPISLRGLTILYSKKEKKKNTSTVHQKISNNLAILHTFRKNIKDVKIKKMLAAMHFASIRILCSPYVQQEQSIFT